MSDSHSQLERQSSIQLITIVWVILKVDENTVDWGFILGKPKV